MTCHAKVPSLSSTSPRSSWSKLYLTRANTGTTADVAGPAVVVAEIEQAVDHRRQDADIAVQVADEVSAVEQVAVKNSFVDRGALQPASASTRKLPKSYPPTTSRSKPTLIDVDGIVDVEHVDTIVEGKVEVCILDDHHLPSTPTYQALSIATAGVASAVEASAAIMASFRIEISPFTCVPRKNCPNTL